MIVDDAGVLIAQLDEPGALHEQTVERLLAAAGETLGCSTLTLAWCSRDRAAGTTPGRR